MNSKIFNLTNLAAGAGNYTVTNEMVMHPRTYVISFPHSALLK
jgi:hypothetical protein